MFAIDDALLAEEKTRIQKTLLGTQYFRRRLVYGECQHLLHEVLNDKEKRPKLLENEARNFSTLVADKISFYREAGNGFEEALISQKTSCHYHQLSS